MEQNVATEYEFLFKKFVHCIITNDLTALPSALQKLETDSCLKNYFIKCTQNHSFNDNPDYPTLLYYAVSHQNYAMTKMLLKLKALPNEISPMIQKCNKTNLIAHTKISDVNSVGDLENEETPIVLAALLKNEDLVCLLLSYGANPLIYDRTTREKDFQLSDAQEYIMRIRDKLIKLPYEIKIKKLEEKLKNFEKSIDNRTERFNLTRSQTF